MTHNYVNHTITLTVPIYTDMLPVVGDKDGKIDDNRLRSIAFWATMKSIGRQMERYSDQGIKWRQAD